MKKYLIIGTFLFTGLLFANHPPKHEVLGDLVKSTYFHENGTVSQEGYYKNGKVHGKWTSYDASGKKKAMGEYNEGVKSGKWIFWNDITLSEVDYSESRVASVKIWKEAALVNKD